MVGRRQCLRQHLESSFFGSAGEGGGKEGGWIGGEGEEGKMGGRGGRGKGSIILASDVKYVVDFAGLPSTVDPPRVLRVSKRCCYIVHQ